VIAYPNAAIVAAVGFKVWRCGRHSAECRRDLTKARTAHSFSVRRYQARIRTRRPDCQPIYYTPYPICSEASIVSHTKSEKVKLLNRIRRVRGQIEAVERALEEEKGCATVLHLIVAARGAMNSLMTELIEDHIRLHVVDPVKGAERSRGAEELIEAVQAYLK
jgi:DNA-binding FrmR family transcriptional regulator